MRVHEDFDWIVLSPAGTPDPALPIAASRAGAVGLLDLQFTTDREAALAALSRLAALGRGRCGALLDGGSDLLAAILAGEIDGLEIVALADPDASGLGELVASIHAAGYRAIVVATSLEQALAAEDAEADAVIAKGDEAGGWVGVESTFVLLQRCVGRLRTPVYAHGGIGLHTAAACSVAGAAGAVLDGQLLLAREAPLPAEVQSELRNIDGSETICLGAGLGAQVRIFSRPALAPVAELQEAELSLEREATPTVQHRRAWRTEVRRRIDWTGLGASVLAVGQDAAFAADLARRFSTVGGIIAGLDASIAAQRRSVSERNALAEGSPLARSHGTRFPIVQGPMTRVSDTAEFAAAVAEAGGLPFLALALLRGPDVAALLEETHQLMDGRPWGAGVLGFVPAELREEQLAAIRATPPPYALIAGGRPDQARALEDDGIKTYLHVPSPGLLKLYVKDGARRFVFEGRECGGHVGPRSSFVLWDTMVRALLDEIAAGADAGEFHVLFAGGIHDGLSGAMAAAIAAPLANLGVHVGALVGTAYLFTEEAVDAGAITATFQAAAVAGRSTVLLETGPGHATRCLVSPFADEFQSEKRRLRRSDLAPDEVRNRLEAINLGRLRIASKGVDRNPLFERDPTVQKLVTVEPEDQWAQGMFMIGEVAALREEVCTIEQLHREIAGGSTRRVETVSVTEAAEAAPAPADVAVVGIGCIFPGAPDLSSFWANVLGKVDAVTEIPASRWDWRPYFDTDRNARDKVYSRWGGFIDPVPFDPVAFGMPPNSLRSIEPFQLLALLVADAALRDAGYATRPFARERTSVIFGAGGGGADLSVGYTVRSSLPKLFGGQGFELADELGAALPEWTEDSFAGLLMNVASGRIANRFDLGGTNYTVDAACASSLAAVALAAREVQTRTSDMAIVGGIDAIQNPFAYLCFSKTQALSPTGHCRPFDAEADGIAISEGFAAVVLKRLADAERDGDRIYAVIRGVGAASDGRDRSLTAPRPEGQMRALRRAYAQAGVSPATVGLVEAHGTGTVAGDRAEVEALSTVFGEAGAPQQGCALGSVKSMIGHTKATAGVAGLIKSALALHHRVLPATIGVTEPNPKANFPDSPFYVNTETRPWIHTADHPRRAGVSAFGFGGTDFHIVVEEYADGFLPSREPVLDRWPGELFLWRGDSGAGIGEAIDALAARLEAGAEPALADLAYTLALRAGAASAEKATLAIVADSASDLAQKLRAARTLIDAGDDRQHTPSGIHYAARPLAADGQVAFLFPGQGSQSVNMARELAVVFPEVRECYERSDRVLDGCFGQPLSSYVFPRPVFSRDDEKEQQAALTDTHVAQPALGATDFALFHLLRSFGVEPQLVAGHSYGEFVALAAAGSLREDDLMRLSEARGRFISEGSGEDAGAMAAVDAAPAVLAPLLDDPDLVIANVNAPEQTVVSGGHAAIERAIAWCEERELRARVLPVACAFHSPYVEPAQRRLAELLAETEIAAPRIPVFSNTTAQAYPDDPAAVAGILGEHLIRPVEFDGEIGSMYDAGARIFVEVGPRAVLTGLVGRILEGRPHLAVPVDQPGRSGLVQLLHCLAALAAEGVSFRTERLFEGREVRRLNLEGLEPVEGHGKPSSALWMVDGGRALPVSAAAEPVPSPVELDGVIMNRDDSERVKSGAAHPVVQPAPVVSSTPPTAPADERVGDVMQRHLQLMQHFLEMHENVVLAYLGQPRPAGVPERPVPALDLHVGNGKAALPPQAILPEPQPVAAPAVAEPPPVVAAPPPAAVEPAPPAASNGHHPPVAGEDLSERLLAIVSERTGYPLEMLELDADLEADLGIDSIKRVEIVGTMIQTLSLKDGVTPDVEEITSSRTLRQAIAALETLANGKPPAASSAATPMLVEGEPSPFDGARADKPESARARIDRYVLRAVAAPPVSGRAPLARDGVVVIVDDGTGVGEELADRLRARGDGAVRIVSGRPVVASDIVVDRPLADPAAVARLADDLGERHGTVKGLVYLRALGAGGRAGPDDELTELFLLTRALGGELERAANAGGGVVVGATSMGGTFGVDPADSPLRPAQGGIPGFLKSLALEWPAVRVKAVDLASAVPAADLAASLLGELDAADGVVEVGYRDGRRTMLELVRGDASGEPEAPPLGRDSVVLITGGARGITAEVALALAEQDQPTLVLVGRTPEPGEEDPATCDLIDPRELRQAIIDRLRAEGATVSPAAVEAEYRALLSSREVRANLARLRATGARVEYLACDVRDVDAFGSLVDRLYDTYGRIDGVIHGAGIIEDRLVRDKDPASFERVVATKAGAARTLVERLRPEALRFLVFFGSVSGRFGNRGQADYAAASDVLNKLAQQLDRRWPGRVATINWGPWKAGMVSRELEQEFARRGVELIPRDVGCRFLLEELRVGRKGEAEVVIGGASGLAGAEPERDAVAPEAERGDFPLLALNSAVTRTADGSVEAVRTLELVTDLYLNDHRIDGRPVLPFAAAMELLAETAAAGHPEREFAALRQIRVLQGITVDAPGYGVRVTALPAAGANGHGHVLSLEGTIRALDGDRAHYRALVDLCEPGASPAELPQPARLDDLAPFPTSIADAYRDLLFHGPLFQRIASIEGMDERGATSIVLPSSPSSCLRDSSARAWLLDPVLVDCALQLQVIWARLHWDVTLLPGAIGSVVRFASDLSGADGIRHELRIRPESSAPLCHCDHYFYAPSGRLLAAMTDVQGIGSKALNRLAGAVG